MFEEEDCGSDRFISAVTQVSRQIRAHGQLDQSLPAVAESAPELIKLKNKINLKIREYLITKINSLKKSGTNIHMIQKNTLTKSRKLMRFLKQNEPVIFAEVSSYYVSTVGKIFSNQFKQYVHGLSKFGVEQVGSKIDLVGHEPPSVVSTNVGGVAASVASDLMKLKLPSAPPQIVQPSSVTQKNLFSIDGRDRILNELDSDAILVASIETATTTTTTVGIKYYPETFIRSHQKLLCDTAANEYLFLLDFFDLHRPQSPSSNPEDRIERYFELIFGQGTMAGGGGRILSWFTEQISGNVRESFDVIGLLLVQSVITHFQDVMINKRKIAVLDSYFETLVGMIRARVKVVMDIHADSLKRYKITTTQSNTTVLPVTRRFTDLLVAICISRSRLDGDIGLTVDLEKSFDQLLVGIGKKFENIFLINNYSHIVTGLRKAGSSDGGILGSWESRLGASISLFVEKKILSSFNSMIKLTLDGEKNLTTTGAQPLSPRSSPSLTDLERCVLSFQSNWKSELEKIRTEIFSSGFSPDSSSAVLKALRTQFLLYYTRFQKVVSVRTSSSSVSPAWVKQIVPTTVIMGEIRNITA